VHSKQRTIATYQFTDKYSIFDGYLHKKYLFLTLSTNALAGHLNDVVATVQWTQAPLTLILCGVVPKKWTQAPLTSILSPPLGGEEIMKIFMKLSEHPKNIRLYNPLPENSGRG
jgi:hypothetical protein